MQCCQLSCERSGVSVHTHNSRGDYRRKVDEEKTLGDKLLRAVPLGNVVDDRLKDICLGGKRRREHNHEL